MASRDVSLERIKLEVKKEMLLSIEGMATSIKKPVKSSEYCQQKWRKGDMYFDGSYRTCRNLVKSEVNLTVCNSEIPVLQCLMAQLPVYCKYKSDGCQEILMKEDMANHEEGCVYRPTFCADLNCTQKSTYHGLMEHVTQVHKGLDVIEKKKFVIINSKMGALNSQKLATTRISAFDFTFFEVGTISGQLMFKWIYVLGDSDVAKNFYYHVKIKNASGVELIFNDQVRSLSEYYFDIITRSFKAFSMPIARVKEFLDDNSQMVLEYQIRNMKEEAKDDNEESGISYDDE